MEARPELPEQPEPKNPGRVFHTERVAPRDAMESVTEQLARGGSGDGVIDETYDTRVKIGEALEGSARAIGDKPVERSDAAAIRVAEASALGGDAERGAIPGGVAERAQAAAAANACAARDEDKVTMTDVLTWEATMKLPTGKAVTSEVAAAAAEAEAANDPRAETNPRGVSAALDMAAKHNLNTSAPLE
ncbi:late embryogenesis abundant protein D-34-like [Miscanthus floridulus]|uniref:late embryogenesis abundant protein D-34-like n=1 Tax=Miscanthus floridulus TaxID=154761 RepID=UPI003457D35B